MKRTKRLMTLTLVAILSLMVFAGEVAAYVHNGGADNYIPISNFYVTAYEWRFLGSALKEDATSHYFYNDSDIAYIGVQSYGVYSNGTIGQNVTFRNGEYVDYSVCQNGAPYRITNHVNEDGYLYCTLALTINDYSALFSGAWNPDTKVPYSELILAPVYDY